MQEEDHNQEIVMLIRITELLVVQLIHQDVEEVVVQEDEVLLEEEEVVEVVSFSSKFF